MYYKINEKLVDTGDFVRDLLNARGIDNVKEYLNPTREDLFPPDELKYINEGAKLLLKHLENNSKIYVVIDCDNDGITSAAALILYIYKIKPDANIYWTMHDGKQHGVELEKVEEGTDLVIIPDAGSNQFDEHKILFDRGIDVLVIDHHESEHYDDYSIIINNQMCNYPNKSLSGAGVVYKFLQKLDQILNLNYADYFLDLIAVGIIGDTMSLQNLENRYIVYHGLKNINNFALKTFIKKQEFSIGNINNLSPNSISFYISPLINAIIRVGTKEEKNTLFKAFLNGKELVPSTKRGAKKEDLEVCAEQAARYGTNCRNRQNKILDAGVDYLIFKIKKEELDDNKIIFICLDEMEETKIPSELSGLVAMQIAKRFGKPTIVTRMGNDNEWSGSARGIDNSDLNDFKKFLNDSHFFTFAEGHPQAFGLKINNSKVEKFIDYANKELINCDFNDNNYIVDYSFTESDSDTIIRLINELDSIKNLWGKGVEEPLIAISNLTIQKENIQLMGKNNDSIKINKNNYSIVKFKDKNFIDEILKYDLSNLTLIGKVQINEWMGQKTPQIIVVDYEVKDDLYAF